MSLRLKVYGLIALLALAGGGYYCYKTKPAWFSSVAQAKADDAGSQKKGKGSNSGRTRPRETRGFRSFPFLHCKPPSPP